MRLYTATECNTEIDLVPLLSLMVALIPILLLSSVFMHITIIETTLPQAVQAAIEENKKDPTVSIGIHINQQKDIIVQVANDGKVILNETIQSLNGVINHKSLNSSMVQIKRQHPHIFTIDLTPSESISYEEIVKVMDQVRTAPSSEPQFEVKDPKTNEIIKTHLMFPDIVFANTLEGST